METVVVGSVTLLFGLVVGVLVGALIVRARRAPDPLPDVQRALETIAERAERLHEAQVRSEASVHEHLRFVQDRYGALQHNTEQITRALTGGQTRGHLGEMQLDQLLQHAGLLEGTHYTRHPVQSVDDARLVPDVVIRMPQGGEIAIDAKFPFDAYWSAIQQPEQRTEALARHARDVLTHASHLASRGYARANPTLDSVVMFLPFETLLISALEADGLLLEKAFAKRVIVATPTTMLALLRTVHLGHERVALAENAEHIRAEGAEMLKRLGTLVEHLEAMRRGLAGAVSGFNALVGSFDRQALSQARRLHELGVSAPKGLDAPTDIDEPLRAVSGRG